MCDLDLRNFNLMQVLLQGEGFERNLQLFVFACVVIARREEDGESFNFYDFVVSHSLYLSLTMHIACVF